MWRLDLTLCGLIEVSDASLGGVDRSVQDGRTVKVHTQAGIGIFIGEKPIVALGARGKYNVLDCDSRSITRVCRFEHGRRNSRIGIASRLNAVLCGLVEWDSWRPCTIFQEFALGKKCVTDTRHVYYKVSTEKSKALTMEIATIRDWLVTSSAQIRWTANENMIMDRLTKDQRESRQHFARVLQEGEWSVQRDALLIREKTGA